MGSGVGGDDCVKWVLGDRLKPGGSYGSHSVTVEQGRSVAYGWAGLRFRQFFWQKFHQRDGRTDRRTGPT